MKNVDRWLLNSLFACLGLRLLSGVIKAFLPHELPHRWRENDTYGVAVRYFLRWTVETGEAGTQLLPAVLNSGDALGITPMELPIYNLLAAPFMAAGEVWGHILAHLFMYAVCGSLLYAAALFWNKERIQAINMRLVCLLLALFTLSSSFIFKFMPDFLSFILVFIGLSAAWTRSWTIKAFIFTAVGLLIKPTSIVVLGLVLLHPNPVLFARNWVKWAVPAALLTVLFFVVGLDYVRTLQDVHVPFAVEIRDPVASLIDFFSQPARLLKFLTSDLVFVPGLALFIVVLPALGLEEKKVAKKLLLVFFMQMLGLAVLAGAHSFKHTYYFIGTAPTLAMLLVNAYYGVQSGRLPSKIKVLVVALCFLSALVTMIEGIRSQLRSVLPVYSPDLAFQRDCQLLKERNPDWPWNQGYVFRGFGKVFSEAAVCFHEREGNAESSYGIFTAHEPLPSACKIIDQEGNGIIATCR